MLIALGATITIMSPTPTMQAECGVQKIWEHHAESVMKKKVQTIYVPDIMQHLRMSCSLHQPPFIAIKIRLQNSIHPQILLK